MQARTIIAGTSMGDGDRIAKLPIEQFLLYLQHRIPTHTNLRSCLCENLLSGAFMSFGLSSTSCSSGGGPRDVKEKAAGPG